MKLLRTLGVLAMVVTAPALAAAQVPQQVAGTITYREKVALPPTGLTHNLDASAEYRAHLAGVMARRAVAAALA